MARPKKPQPEVIRRSPGAPRKKLPADFEALARGEKMPRKAPAGLPRLDDPREDFLVRGVANRDARAVFDARFERMREDRAKHPGDPEATARLAEALAEAVALGLWRGRRLTSLEALAEQLLDLTPDEARKLAEQGALMRGTPSDPLRDEAVALWLRVEAALAEAGVAGRASIRHVDGEPRLRIELALPRATEGVIAIAKRIAPLRGGPRPDRDATRPGERRPPERSDRRPPDRGRPPERDKRAPERDRGPSNRRFRRED